MRRRIDLRCELAEVSRLNAWLAERFREAALPDKTAGDIKLCLNEMAANAISYGFPDGGAAEISVDLDIGKDKAVATLVDNGIAFDPLAAPGAGKITDLETAQIGGFGIMLTRQAASSIRYERTEGRNRLTMTFHYA